MSDVIQKVRERLANNGRNTANGNRGIPTGSDLHLCEMLLAEIAAAAAFLDGLAERTEARGPDDEEWLDKIAADCRAEARKLRGKRPSRNPYGEGDPAEIDGT